MAESTRPRGACAYCGREMTRGGLSRHLAGCKERGAAIAAADAGKGESGPQVHLQVQDAWGGDYWLHLEMQGSAPLGELDHYLRAIWLECCGHMSRFSVGGWGGEEFDMDEKAADVLQPGVELTHIYDFGTDSQTLIRVVAVRQGKPLTRHPITLMARNAPPAVACQDCGEPATRLCLECPYDEQPGTLCAAHARKHRHRELGKLPLLNSPRSGMCGYDGPAKPPY